MTDEGSSGDANPELDAFHKNCSEALAELFQLAKEKEELQFAMALNPEMRGMQDAGWNTAREAMAALEEYLELIAAIPPENRIRVRVGLSLYAHLSEASGFYEVPKNMLRIASGEDYNLWPFQNLVRRRAIDGAVISPNANKVMQDLLGHAAELGLENLNRVIVEAFDPDLRNGYAHADYVIWDDGIRLRKRNGGYPSVVGFEEFTLKLNKAISFFHLLQELILSSVRSYSPPKRVVGRMNNRAAALPSIIAYDEEAGEFSISTGMHL